MDVLDLDLVNESETLAVADSVVVGEGDML